MSVEIDTRIEWAYGADLTANPATWTWTDESNYALGSVLAQWGAQDEGSQTQPTAVSFRLRNTDYRFTPRHPMGAHYPYVRQWTPIRISQNLGAGFVQRFVVYIDEITPVWPDGTEAIAEVEVTARGALSRLGEELLSSAMRRSYDADVIQPIAYWPLEEAEESGLAYDVINGTPSTVGGFSGAAGAVGRPKFGAAALAPGSAPAANIGGGWNLDLNMPAGLMATGTITGQFTINLGTSARTGTFVKSHIRQHPGTNARHLVWEVYARDSGVIELQVLEADAGLTGVAGPTTILSTGAENFFDGQPRTFQLSLVASGGTNVAWTLYMNDVSIGSGTHVPSFAGAMNAPPWRSASLSSASADQIAAIGHIAVYTAAVTPARYAPAVGYRGESATTRMTRLCTEEGIQLAIAGTSDAAMGPQGVSGLVTLLRECEAVDGGILYDGFSAGLSYITADGRSSLAATMTLDCNRQQVKLPFEPVENGQRRRNQWTVSRLQGASRTFTDGAAVAADGVVRPDSASVNVDSDLVLSDQAAWRTNLTTVDEMRVPGITLQLIDRPELWTPWLTMRPGLRMTAANLPVQYPPGRLDMALEGAAENWDSVSWRIEANTAPYAPWRIALFAAETGDTSEFVGRADTDGSILVNAVNSSATSLLVNTNVAFGEPWTTATDDLPLSIGITGEQITISAIASFLNDAFTRTVAAGGWGTATSGQTWTVTGTAADYLVSVTRGRITTNTIASLYYSIVDTGVTNQRVEITTILSVSPTGAGITPRVVCRWADASNYYEAQLLIDVAGPTSLSLRKRVAGVSSQIATSASVGVHAAGDSWRIVLDVIGSTIAARAWNSTSGRDPGYWQVTATDTDLTAGTFAGVGVRRETGNTNGATAVDFDNAAIPNPQTLTVSARAVNGVSKAQAAGAAVSLWAPPVFGK